jgi:hypothetical protein
VYRATRRGTACCQPISSGREFNIELLQREGIYISALRKKRALRSRGGICVNNFKAELTMESEVRELLVEQVKDAYSAEKQALRCMQKAVKKAAAPALREGIQLHIEQTQTQIERVERVMETMQVRPGRKVCEAMRGLVEEAQNEIEEQDGKGPILDLVIVAGMQRIEHYEIAA